MTDASNTQNFRYSLQIRALLTAYKNNEITPTHVKTDLD